jgi:excinuclease ABC subunit C
MMREVMQRRFSRLLKDHGDEGPVKPAANEDPDAAPQSGMPAWPDLVLIDGGKGQMSAVRTILEELGIADKITAIGVAKGMDREAGRERFFIRRQAGLHAAAARSGAVFHPAAQGRGAPFAIGSHRARRKKDMVANPLDEIAGIGPTRKRALLHHFGTAKAVSRAGIDDLVAVEGISRAVAELVYNHFHEENR